MINVIEQKKWYCTDNEKIDHIYKEYYWRKHRNIFASEKGIG